MATIIWESAARHWCDLQKCEAELLEQRVYPGDSLPDTRARYQVRARRCSLALDCNLAGYYCRWAWTNPDNDPFAGV